MIASLMIYCLSIAVLVTVAALAIERTFAALGRPRRVVWIAALIASLCLPLILMASGSSDDAPMQQASVAATVVEAPISDGAAAQEASISSRLSVATMLKGAWLFTSGGLLLFAILGWVQLRYSARLWKSQLVDGVLVRVAENLGPAVVGYLNPEIVVPRWLLAAPETDRRAVIAHEQSHIAANDTLAWLLGLLLVAIAPWNLPMWWQLHRLRFAIEVDCDQRVLRDGVAVATYGEMLIAVAQRHIRTPIGAMAITENASQLERRIRIMTSETRQHAKLLILGSLAMSASIATVAAQLDAPSLSAITPNLPSLFAPKSSTYEAPQLELPASTETPGSTETIKSAIENSAAAQVPASSAVGETATIDPSTPGIAERSPRPALRLAQTTAKKLAKDPQVAAAADTAAQDASKLRETSTPTPVKLEIAHASAQETTERNRPLKRLTFVRPELPEAALRDSVTGWVEVAFTVNVSGAVIEAEVRGSQPEGIFDEAALTSVRQWRFEPALKDGQAVPTRTMIRLNFSAPPDPNRKSEAINLKFIGIPTREVLSLLAKTRGRNMIIDDRVSGTITVNLQNVPWDEALDYILRSQGLIQRQQGDSIVIEPAPTTRTAP